MDSYLKTLAYLDSFINYEKKPAFGYKESLKLERVRDFLASINDPQDSFPCIHIAGTKGKGSVCAFTASILRALGYRTGLYTSPHLSDVRERIRILEPGSVPLDQKFRGLSPGTSVKGDTGTQEHRSTSVADDFEGMITREELAALVKRLQPKIDAYCAKCSFGALSFFEVYTALAFSYFKEKKVDVAVLETGLGGRLDATNVSRPAICGITSISFDHMDKLGSTLEEIAQEKAGIIKSHQVTRSSRRKRDTGAHPYKRRVPGHQLIVVSAPQEEPVRNVIRQRCESQGAVLYEVNRNIIVEAAAHDGRAQVFSLKTPWGDFRDVRIRLLGQHQVTNAAVAVSLAAGYQAQRNRALDKEALAKGLAQARWPARFEVFGQEKNVVIDGAHNPAAARALRITLEQYCKDKNIILVLGISKDKDVPGIMKELTAVTRRIIVTKADNPRALDPGAIRDSITGVAQDVPVTISGSVGEALAMARRSAASGDVIVVTGSIFVAGEARELIRTAPDHDQSRAKVTRS